MHLTAVIFPRNTENNLTLWFTDALDNFAVGKLGVLGNRRTNTPEDLGHGLVKLNFSRVSPKYLSVCFVERLVEHQSYTYNLNR